MTGAFCLIPDENWDEFNKLHADLSEEHKPATATESMLVNDMARHYWLYQRALRLQEGCFAADLSAGGTQNQLSVFLRYGTTHERAFRRALADLLMLRRERLRLERGFESQGRERAAELRRESREGRLSAIEKREAEAYEKEKNRPPTEFDIMNEYFRETNTRDLREALLPRSNRKKTRSDPSNSVPPRQIYTGRWSPRYENLCQIWRSDDAHRRVPHLAGRRRDLRH